MKKFLSLVLALVMAMSLMTFTTATAGAKDFTDGSSINYKEAADVISAINIMDGYTDGSFGPTATLTRGAAAKIICNMILGPTTASALPTNVAPFPDVAAGSTFAGYIAYCSEHNIISGYADGNFRPSDSLSGYAFLKMLLCALGYDQEIEGYQGANWRVNVAKQALGIGLDDGLNGELDGSRIVTREEAALYAFNTLQADLVEYDAKTSVSVNGATVSVGGSTFRAVTSTSQKSETNHIDGRTSPVSGTNAQIVQFAEEYFPRLERDPLKNVGFTGQGADAFGRPTVTWTWKGAEVGKYPSNLVKTFNGDKKVSEIYSELGLRGTAVDAEVWMNGFHVFDVDISRSKDTKLGELADGDTSIIADYITEFGQREITDVRWVATTSGGHWEDGDGHALRTNANGNDVAAINPKPGTAAGTQAVISGATGAEYNVPGPVAAAAGGGFNDANGAAIPANDKPVFLYDRNGLAYYADKLGNASIMEVYYNSDRNAVVINAMSVYPGQIDGVYSNTSIKDAYVTVAYLNGNNEGNEVSVLGATANYGKKDNDENEFTVPSGFAEDDIVWFTFSARTKEIGKVEKMQSVEGKLTRRTSDAVTIDGTSYDYAKEKRFDMSGGEGDMSYSSSYVLYLAFGNALWIKEAAFSAEYYALVERISAEINNGTQLANSWLDGAGVPQYNTTASGFDSNRVKILLSNGTVRNLDLDSADRYLNSNPIDVDGDGVVDIAAKTRINADYMAGSIVRYVENTDGSYRLYSVRSDLQGRSPYTDTAGVAILGGTQSEAAPNYNVYRISDKHVQSNLWAYASNEPITWPAGNPAAGSEIKKVATNAAGRPTTEITSDTSTIYIVKDKDTYKVYNGLRYAPIVNGTAASTGDAIAYAYTNGGDTPKAKIVFVIRGTPVDSSKDITFLIGSSRSKLFTDSDTDNYYEYRALVNGELTTVAVSSNVASFTTDGNVAAGGVSNVHGAGSYGNMTPADGDKAWNSAILNSVQYDDELIVSGNFTSNSTTVGRQIGIKKTDRTDEVTIGTYKDADGNRRYTVPGAAVTTGNIVRAADSTYVLAANCNIFYCDDDGGARITYNQIPNDKDDIVYYTMNEDGELSNIFIVDFEA